jgi:hypothetical protein
MDVGIVNTKKLMAIDELKPDMPFLCENLVPDMPFLCENLVS